jgi:hypothetical protein
MGGHAEKSGSRTAGRRQPRRKRTVPLGSWETTANLATTHNSFHLMKLCSSELHPTLAKCWEFDLQVRWGFLSVLETLRPLAEAPDRASSAAGQVATCFTLPGRAACLAFLQHCNRVFESRSKPSCLCYALMLS